MIKQLNNKARLFLLYTALVFLYFSYLIYDFIEYASLKKNYFSQQKTLSIEKEITQKFELLKSEGLVEKKNSITEIYTTLTKNKKIRLEGFIPSDSFSNITLFGDYYDLLDAYQALTTQFQFKTEAFSLLLPENTADFSLSLKISASLASLNDDEPPEKTPPSFALHMIGYLSYGLEHWCILEDENHLIQLSKEGAQIKQGFIQSIQPKHLLLKNHTQNYLIPLSLPSHKK